MSKPTRMKIKTKDSEIYQGEDSMKENTRGRTFIQIREANAPNGDSAYCAWGSELKVTFKRETILEMVE